MEDIDIEITGLKLCLHLIRVLLDSVYSQSLYVLWPMKPAFETYVLDASVRLMHTAGR